MDCSKIEAKVLSIIKEKIGMDAIPSLDQRLREDIGMDSLDEVEFIMALEDEYDIEISDSDAMACKTPKDAVNFLVRQGIRVPD